MTPSSATAPHSPETKKWVEMSIVNGVELEAN
jgi:hypothetical protein